MTNARDMAKAEDPECRQKWQALHTQFKAGQISKTEMFAQHNHFVNDRLQDPVLLERFTGMAQEKVLVESSTQASEPATRVSSVPQQELQRIMFEYVAMLVYTAASNYRRGVYTALLPSYQLYRLRTKSHHMIFLRFPTSITSHQSLTRQPMSLKRQLEFQHLPRH